MATYKATWSAGSTYLNGYYEYTIKREAIKDIKDIAKGNRPQGNEANWIVWDAQNGRVVAKGWIDDAGSHLYSKHEVMAEEPIIEDTEV